MGNSLLVTAFDASPTIHYIYWGAIIAGGLIIGIVLLYQLFGDND